MKPRVLMISVGEHMIKNRLSDAVERHIKYSKGTKHLIIIAYANYKNNIKLTKISDKLYVRPTNLGKLLFPFEALFLAVLYYFRFGFDIVTTQDPFITAFIGVILKFIFGLKLDIQNHSDFFSSKYFMREKPLQYRLYYYIGRFLLRFGDHHRVLNYDERDAYLNFKISREKITVLPTPVNSNRFLVSFPEAEIENIKKEYNIENKIVVIWVGRITPAKDWKFLIEITECIDNPDIVFIALGSGEEEEDFKKEIHKKTKKNLLFLGIISHERLPIFYQTAHIYLHTSNYEGFGKTIVEAMLSGLPVITTNTSGARFIISNKEVGIIIDTKKPEIFKEKILELANNKALRISMGILAKGYAQKRFSQDYFIKQIIDTWKRLLNS